MSDPGISPVPPKSVSPPLGGPCVLRTHLLFTGKDPEGCGHRHQPGIFQKACLWLRWAMGQAGWDSATPGKETVVRTTPRPHSPWRLGSQHLEISLSIGSTWNLARGWEPGHPLGRAPSSADGGEEPRATSHREQLASVLGPGPVCVLGR